MKNVNSPQTDAIKRAKILNSITIDTQLFDKNMISLDYYVNNSTCKYTTFTLHIETLRDIRIVKKLYNVARNHYK